MNSTPLRRACVAFLLVTAIGSPCAADILTTSGATHFGRLVSIDGSGAAFEVGCNPNQRISVPLASFGSVSFDQSCAPTPQPVRSPAGASCSTPLVSLFTVLFANGQAAWATSLSADRIRLTMQVRNASQISGPTSSVTSIVYSRMCPEYVGTSSWPNTFK
jgi:hypothetical protein